MLFSRGPNDPEVVLLRRLREALPSASTAGPRSAAVTLLDGTVLTIGPDSALDLSQYQFNPTTQEGSVLVNLMRGSLRMVTGLIAKLKPEQVKVTTPTSVIGVRGTDFIVEENP